MNPHIDIENDAEFMEINDRVGRLSVTSIERRYALYQAARYCNRNGIAGDFVECGVFRGGSALLLASVLVYDQYPRELFLYDTFEGLPPHGEHDRAVAGVGPEHFEGDVLAASEEEVRANVAKSGILPRFVTLVKGDVRDTLPRYNHNRIALLHLDTDWHDSTNIELELLYPRVARGGVVLADDYGHWLGQKKAVDDYFNALGSWPLLCRTDYSGRMWVKP